MTLAPGSRLGPYEILSLLGAGGMGEVYRASDPRLGREVELRLTAWPVPEEPSDAAQVAWTRKRPSWRQSVESVVQLVSVEADGARKAARLVLASLRPAAPGELAPVVAAMRRASAIRAMA